VTNIPDVVYVVDDDPSIRRSLERLFRSVGHECISFGSAEEFLECQRRDAPSCLVLDVRLPGLSGLDLQRELAEANAHIPIIFLTGHGGIPLSVRAMKAGALDFLTKPFHEQDLLDAVRQAIDRDEEARRQRAETSSLRQRFETLTPRERGVFSLIVSGMLNKQVAGELGASERTIKFHRHRLMEKMEAASLADLVRTAEKLGIPASRG
jgi:FixJ family two-component response regulator